MKKEPMKTARLLTAEECSELTGWKISTIRKKILRRELPYVKLGARSVRIPIEAIENLIERGYRPAI